MSVRFAADMAYPINFKALPAEVAAVLGYVGGNTPHVWTPAEVKAAESSAKGRVWWAIWTAPQRSLKTGDGWAAATGMILALQGRSYDKTRPVFLDVEHDAWTSNPVGAQQCIDGWKAHMNAAGYAKAFAYVPLVAGFDWVAWWTNEPPSELPPKWIGQQFGGETGDNAYDLSVFDARLWDSAALPASSSVPAIPPMPGTEIDGDEMQIIARADDGTEYVLPADLSTKRNLVGPSVVEALKSTGLYKEIALESKFLTTIPDAPNRV